MENKKDDGGLVYPQSMERYGGITRRDALIDNLVVAMVNGVYSQESYENTYREYLIEKVPQLAVEIADGTIKESHK